MKIKRILYIFLVLSWLFSLCIVSFSAYENECVTDHIGTLTEDQRLDLDRCLSALEQRTGYRFRLYVYEELYSPYYGEDYLDEHGFYEGDDLFLLIVSRYEGIWYYDLYTYGACDAGLSDFEVDALLDLPDVYDNLKSGNVHEGATVFFTQAEQLLANDEMKGDTPLQYRFGPALVLALLAALVPSLIIVFLYKRKSRSASYPLDEFTTLSLTRSDDTFIGSTVRRSYVPRSSNNGGSGASGGGRGGGGGHRGGR